MVAAVVAEIVEAEEAEEVVDAAAAEVVKMVRTKIVTASPINPVNRASLGELDREVQDIRISRKAMVSAICISGGAEELSFVQTRGPAHGRMFLRQNNETVTSSALLTLIY